MNFQDFVKKNKPLIKEHLRVFLSEKKKEKITHPFYLDTIEKLEKLSLGGKMWRGLFVLLCCQISQDKQYSKKILNAAIAMELIQSALLIHDDIIDNDYTRRGQSSVFAQYIGTNDEAYGKNLAICVGDIAIFLAYDALARATSEPAQMQKIIQLFSRELHLVGIGEMIDVQMAASEEKITYENIIDMYRYKTARYSFSLPFILGAILGNGKKDDIEALDTFGENMGILFQIHDDALGLTGDESATGKPVGADIKENKKTLHRTLLFDAASNSDVSVLKKSFGNKKLTEAQWKKVIGLLEKYEIQNKVDNYSQGYRAEAMIALQELSYKDNHKQLLEDILKRVTNRSQ